MNVPFSFYQFSILNNSLDHLIGNDQNYSMEGKAMSHFYGVIQGQAGKATRRGSKASGVQVTAASWDGAIQVRVYHQDGVDKFVVTMEPWKGHGDARPIARGIVGDSKSLIFGWASEKE